MCEPIIIATCGCESRLKKQTQIIEKYNSTFTIVIRQKIALHKALKWYIILICPKRIDKFYSSI